MSGSSVQRTRRVTALSLAFFFLASSVASVRAETPPPSAPVSWPSAPGPETASQFDAITYDRDHPDAAPAGSNDMTCVVSPDRPPVILVHGTDASAYSDWALLATVLHRDGRCVHAANYGRSPDGTVNGWAEITRSADELAVMVDDVRAATGASEVDLVGYSQGAAVTRYFANRVAPHAVRSWVGIAAPVYGSTFHGLVPAVSSLPGGREALAAAVTPALAQLMAGSDFLRSLNEGGDTVPGIRYTSIATRVDETISPYTNALLRDVTGTGIDATNVVVQNVCPGREVAHFVMTYDPVVIALVRAALDPDAEYDVPCSPLPIGSGVADVVLATNRLGPASIG